MSSDGSLDAIEESLRRRFRVVETRVTIGGRNFDILHPASAEELIDEVDFDRDERLPYWAELWPSSHVLGSLVLAMHGDHRTLLELGCGSGLISACAATVDFRVVASDYYDDACRFARVNVKRNGGLPARGMLLDWRHLPSTLPRFDVVLAADVLYERPYGALVARAIAAALAPDGVAYLADPGRVGRADFTASLKSNHLVIAAETSHPFVDGSVRQSISVFEVVRTS